MLYKYEAIDKEGISKIGEFDASDKSSVIEYIEKKGWIPISVKNKSSVDAGGLLSMSLFETIKPIDRIIFVRNLAATVRSGLSISESLDILIADANKKVMKNILVQAKINLQNGQPLSSTFSAFKNFFPSIFVGMLKAGESVGNLDKTLEELARHLLREYNLTKKIKSALAYPILLFIASIAVSALLLTFIMPKLTKAFRQSGVALPAITKFVIGLSNMFTYSILIDALALAFIIWFFTYFRKTAAGQRFFLSVAFKIPVIRDLVRKVALVRFTRTLGSLISSGAPIIDSMNLASASAGNEYYRNAILDSVEQIKNGIPLSKALESHEMLFPKFLTSLVSVGERTGTLDGILKNFSDFYDEEIDNSLKDLTVFLEPALLLFMGVVVGTIALSILLPIYQLVGKFK